MPLILGFCSCSWYFFRHKPNCALTGTVLTPQNKNSPLFLFIMLVFVLNFGIREDGDVWWEGGMTKQLPKRLVDWKGQPPWTPDSKTTAAHANSWFIVHASQCPVIDPCWEDSICVALVKHMLQNTCHFLLM